MIAITLPHVMTRSEFGWPMYGARLATGEIFISVPFLPERLGAHWETLAEAEPGCEELAAGTWAQAFFLSGIDPDRTDAVTAIQAADRVLTDHLCNLVECAADVAAELADCPASCTRWSRCVVLAARLIGAGA